MKIFISHSSDNNAHALALEQWLIDVGWKDEYFLDVSETRGLVAGEVWQEKLKRAAHRCEVVIILISRAWIDSPWCLTEYYVAKQLGKMSLAVLIEDIDIKELPGVMTADLQLCNLVHGADQREFVVERDPLVSKTSVRFAQSGLDSLERSLQNIGVGVRAFPWPPKDEPERPPYRGLQPFTEKDAAIFFGREAHILRCMDEIRRMQDGRIQNTLIILGASGSGKSSFMRAGILPRLKWEQQRYFVLPPVRPGRDVLTSDEGLISSLHKAFDERGLIKNRGDISSQISEPEKIAALLADLVNQSPMTASSSQHRVTVVLPIDQAEELYVGESQSIGNQFLDKVTALLKLGDLAQTSNFTLDLLVILTIRTDMFQNIQRDERFDPDQRQLVDLPAMDSTQYKLVIEGPAVRSTEAGNDLTIDADLSDKLLKDVQEGADSLPLLAFTLEQLFINYGSDEKLTLDEYEKLGGIQGSIESAIDNALQEPGLPPQIPASREEQLELLRRAFISSLTDIDEQTGEIRRRVARWEEIPVASRPVISRFIEKRLLIKDTQIDESTGDVDSSSDAQNTVEVAHEALLRHWSELTTWIEVERDNLKFLTSLSRAARSWEKEGRKNEWLDHTGKRLTNAKTLVKREDFVKRVGETELAYIAQCRKASARRWQYLSVSLVFIVAVILGLIDWQRGVQSGVLASASFNQLGNNDDSTSLRLALAASQQRFITSPPREAALSLHTAAYQSVTTSRIDTNDPITLMADSPNGELLIAGAGSIASLWDVNSGELLLQLDHGADVTHIAISSDSKQLLTANSDVNSGMAIIWDKETKQQMFAREHKSMAPPAFSPAGNLLVTFESPGVASLWNLEDPDTSQALEHEGVSYVTFSNSGRYVMTGDSNGGIKIWNVTSSPSVQLEEEIGPSDSLFGSTFEFARFSPDDRSLFTVTTNLAPGAGVARIWSFATGTQPIEYANNSGITAATFSSDSEQIITMSNDGSARVRRVDSGESVRLFLHDGNPVTDALFFRENRLVLTTSIDGQLRIWASNNSSSPLLTLDHAFARMSAASLADGTMLAIASLDGVIEIIDADTDRLPMVVRHDRAINHIGFSPTSDWVVTSSDDRYVRTWDLNSGQLVGELQTVDSEPVYSEVLEDAQTIATTLRSGVTIYWDGASGNTVQGPESYRPSELDDDKPIVASGYSVTRTSESNWLLRSGEDVFQISHENSVITHGEFSHDGQWFVSSGDDMSVRIWDSASGQLLATLRHEAEVKHATFSLDDEWLASGDALGYVKLWRLGWLQPKSLRNLLRDVCNNWKASQTSIRPGDRQFSPTLNRKTYSDMCLDYRQTSESQN